MIKSIPENLTLSVIIPVKNGGAAFRNCLNKLRASTRLPDEIIVVDDASTDDSAQVARDAGAYVLSLNGTAQGPAWARNRGAVQARGEVLVFFDADVAVHADTLALIENHLATQPQVVALFGSYDDTPPAHNFVSLYKNLQHHYVHQHAPQEAMTFWAGCGAIRREVFMALGGFDERYARPSIEDIELGMRLHKAEQRVWVCPDILVTHLKKWTLFSWLRSDIFDRAIPWSRLIRQQGKLPNTLNLDATSRFSAVSAWATVVFFGIGFFFHAAWLLAFLAWLVLIALNARLYKFFATKGGVIFAFVAALLHFFYLLYSSIVFVGVFVLGLKRSAPNE